MREVGVESRAEKPERPSARGGGTAAGRGVERQTGTVGGDDAGDGTLQLMEEVVRRENLVAAQARVVSNGGAAGVDGMTVEQLLPYCQQHWARIREELLGDCYQPQAVRRVEIPKPDGGSRALGIPTVLDRLIQQALLQVLQPLIDPSFSDSSYGFRPQRSAHQAVAKAREYVAQGYEWVVDVDLEKFFDRVNHDVLMARVARRVKDKRVLHLIRRFLRAGIMEGGLEAQHSAGTPQGGPLSPLLSNILLDELDKELEQRGHRFVRYADDCNVYVKSEAAGTRVMKSLERFLQQRLRLRINRDKSAVARPWERKFLGFTVTVKGAPRLMAAPQTVQRFKGKLRGLLRKGRGQELSATIVELNRVARGWVAYYRIAQVWTTFAELDQWLRHRLRCILWRQWKKPRTRREELLRRGLASARATALAYAGRGPWASSQFRSMNVAVPNLALYRLGLVSLLLQWQSFARSS